MGDAGARRSRRRGVGDDAAAKARLDAARLEAEIRERLAGDDDALARFDTIAEHAPAIDGRRLRGMAIDLAD